MSERDDVKVWKVILERWKADRERCNPWTVTNKLQPTGDHSRDRLVRERLNLRKEGTS